MEDMEGGQKTTEIISMGFAVGSRKPASSAGQPRSEKGENMCWGGAEALSKVEGRTTHMHAGREGARRAWEGGQMR